MVWHRVWCQLCLIFPACARLKAPVQGGKRDGRSGSQRERGGALSSRLIQRRISAPQGQLCMPRLGIRQVRWMFQRRMRAACGTCCSRRAKPNMGCLAGLAGSSEGPSLPPSPFNLSSVSLFDLGPITG